MNYFLVGIKGVGMTGIATLYRKWGSEVAGSDTGEEFFTDSILNRMGIEVYDFDKNHITSDTDIVVYSTAYPLDHPQITKAKELGIPCLSYVEALSKIFNERKGILVTGTHGKTTCTAMIVRILEGAGLDPTAVVGSEVREWGTTARAGKSEWMVAEGDEYQAKILRFKPYILLLTNIEYDHPDFYPTEEDYKKVFKTLLGSLDKSSFVVTHENLREFVLNSTNAQTMFFTTPETDISLKLWGKHNQTNAQGALEVARLLNISQDQALSTLKEFRGTKRRMELYTKQDDDVVIMDDYAHHPTEIQATLRALREHYPKRTLTVIFHPHTFSRTKALLEDFAKSFKDADNVLLLDIYASAREKKSDITSEDLVFETKKHHKNVYYTKTIEDAIKKVKEFCVANSVAVSMGAGDVWRVAEALKNEYYKNDNDMKLLPSTK